MVKNPTPVRETEAMIRGMRPARRAGRWVFVASPAPDLLRHAAAMVEEAEGRSLVVPLEVAAAAGQDTSLAMAWITLDVVSALDGVGLTAAVATALAEAGIPCNVIAGYHHDHLLVPEAQADAALRILEARAAAG